MIDPAALGTLRIGLDASSTEPRIDRARRPERPRPAIRVTIAGALRRAAAALDTPTMPEAAR